jgi:hypothetical protein
MPRPTFTRGQRAIVVPLALILSGPAAFAKPGDQAIPADDLAFFETHIRPALIESCYECHSEEAGKRKGGLWLDRRSGWADGGDNGPTVVPGDPEKSLLMRSIRYHEPDWEMPPDGKLNDGVIAKFDEWIRRGAPDPRTGETKTEEKGIDLEAGRKFWSFQPIAPPPIPAVKDESWARTEIDRFILARLDAGGLRPAPDAGRATLLRRLTFVLTGLPPTLDEQRAFLDDPSPDAMETVVDRLIASEAHAERWARHWLDIVRYSDTCGGGRTMPLPDAWRFRDYVVASFRQDKGLDQLIREHIAGDRLPSANEDQKMEQLIGTGFLVMGPHVYEEQDKGQLDLDIVDEQLDTIGKAFLGMSLGCARCHDHKFDPIPTRDYYAMAGIFTSTRSIRHANVSQWYTMPYRPTPEEAAAMVAYEREATPLKDRIAAHRRDITRLGGNAGDPDANPNAPAAATSLAGLVLDDEGAEFTGNWQTSSHSRRWVGAGYRHDQGDAKGEKSAVYRIKVDKPGFHEVRVSWSAGPNRSTSTPVTVRHGGGETVARVDQTQAPGIESLFHPIGKFHFPKGEAVIEIGTGGTTGVVIADAVQLLPDGVPDNLTQKAAPSAPATPEAREVARLNAELKEMNARLSQLEKSKPKLPTVMAVDEAEEPGDTPLRVRGMVRSFGDVVPRGFLQVAMPPGAPAPAIESGSGRLELARWITAPENPLTARVMANRIWLHLFGEGIVPDPDNFGTTGSPPSHPELLDYLASRLIAHGWSTKALVREIVLSRAWSMSSEEGDADPLASRVDPDNRLLHRAHRRKIDAETLRDSLLTFSGSLDASSGGPALPGDFKSEYDPMEPSLRRSVYVPVFRNQVDEVLNTFDFANPNFAVGKRTESSIPTQSLFLLNSPFVRDHAERATARLLALTAEAPDDDARIGTAYRMVLGRDPTETEARLSRDFIRGGNGPGDWAALMRTLFGCVDFQYIR